MKSSEAGLGPRCFLGLSTSGCAREGWLMINRTKGTLPSLSLPRLPLHLLYCAGFETHDLVVNFPSSVSKHLICPCPAGQAAAKPVPKAVGNVLFVPALWAGSSSPAVHYSPWLWPRKQSYSPKPSTAQGFSRQCQWLWLLHIASASL